MKFLYLTLVFWSYSFSAPTKLFNLSLQRSNPCQFQIKPKSFKDWATGVNLQQTTQAEMIRLMGLYDKYKAKHANDTEEHEDGFTLRVVPGDASCFNSALDKELPAGPVYFGKIGAYCYSLPSDRGNVLIVDETEEAIRLMRRLTKEELDLLRDRGSIYISGSIQQFLTERSNSYGPVIRLDKALERDRKSRFVDASVGTECGFMEVGAQTEAQEPEDDLSEVWSVCSKNEDENDEFGPGWKGWALRTLWSVFKP